MILITQLGLVVSLIGTLFLAFSIFKNPGEAHQLDEKGEKLFLTVVNLFRFRIGIGLVVFGFLLQLIGSIVLRFL